MALEAAPDGASDSESDDFLSYAEVRQKLLDGSKLMHEAILDRINLMSFKIESKIDLVKKTKQDNTTLQFQLNSGQGAVDPDLMAKIRLAARRLDGLQLSLWKTLSGLEDAITEFDDDVLSVHVAGLFNDFTGSLGFGRTFDLPALGIIPGLPSRDEESLADHDQSTRFPATNGEDSDSISPAVADDRSSGSAADTLFDDLYNDPEEKPTHQYTPAADDSHDVGGGEQPEIDSEDDSVVDDTYQSVRFGSSEVAAAGSQAQDDIIIPGLR